jgi:hypothetical protein
MRTRLVLRLRNWLKSRTIKEIQMAQDILEWLKSIRAASDEEIKNLEAEEDFTPHIAPNNTYSRYVNEDSIVDYGAYIYFKGAGTAGAVCAGFTSGYQVPKLDIVSRTRTQRCPESFLPYFKITYRVAGSVAGSR